MSRRLLQALAVSSIVFLPGAAANDAPDPRDPAQETPSGWSERRNPPSPEALLGSDPAQSVDLPLSFASTLERTTVLIYLSPGCPHCTRVVPELKELHGRLDDMVDFILLISGHISPDAAVTFAAEKQFDFPSLHDEDRAVAGAMGLRSTPSLVVLEPPETEGGPALVREAWLPYIQGVHEILEIRLRGGTEEVFSAGRYLGPITCSACHQEEARAWSATHHSVSYQRLGLAGHAEDEACLRCHVTNLQGEASEGVGGFRPGDHRSPFAAVSCESCHTASGPHDGDGGSPRQTCAGCHSPGHGDLRMDIALPLIDHFAGPEDDEELLARRMALLTGDVERPLAALREGEAAEEGACRSCHKAEHRRWRKTPHGKARNAGGADAATCQSCHGPGKLHVEAKGESYMRPLRTTAPECAVELICAACHSADQEAGWDLREAMERARH